MTDSSIKSIRLKYCKGIVDKEFELNIKPNILNLLVAPNGFGKSSIAHTFNSLNIKNGQLEPKNENFYYRNEIKFQNHETETPELFLIDEEDTYYSNLTDGTILNKYDTYVINSKLSTETEENHQNKSSIIESKFTIEKIPFIGKGIKQEYFEAFTLTTFYKKWHITNTKIYRKHMDFLSDKKAIYELHLILGDADINSEILNLVSEIDKISSKRNAMEMLEIINKSIIPKITNTIILSLLDKCNFDDNKADALINVILYMFLTNTQTYKTAIAFYEQRLEDKKIEEEINNFNTTVTPVYTSYNEGGEFNFPYPELISNGQRDVLTLVTQLLMAKRVIKKEYGIIIIDEVFDYLDESNIIAVQYYILKMINEFKKVGKNVYFLLLTHIDPMYYVTYRYLPSTDNPNGFINVVYLDRKVSSELINNEINYFKNLVSSRNPSNTELNPKLNQYYFHYKNENLENLDFTNIFEMNHLFRDWGKPNVFINYCETSMKNYLTNLDYNPFAVSNFIRYMIEKIVFNKLNDNENLQKRFIKQSETLKKLYFAISNNIDINPSYCLLSYIYNPFDHIENSNYDDNDLRIESEIALYSKLSNLQIKKMINEIYVEYKKISEA